MKEIKGSYIICDVRCSFPSLFERATFEGKETKYEISVLLPKNSDDSKELRELIKRRATEEFDGRIPKKRCLNDGDEMGRPETVGHYVLKGASDQLPAVLNTNGSQATKDQNPIYSGCRVDIKFNLWTTKNYGGYIGAGLMAVKFAGHDEPFTSAHVTPEQAREGFDFSDEEVDF